MFHHSVRKREKKLSVIARLSNFMSLNQRRTLMKTFIESQFGYCPLIWMFHGRTVTKKINHLHVFLFRLRQRNTNKKIQTFGW